MVFRHAFVTGVFISALALVGCDTLLGPDDEVESDEEDSDDQETLDLAEVEGMWVGEASSEPEPLAIRLYQEEDELW